MGKLDGYELHAVRDGAAWTMHVWHDALHQANASVEADLYACVTPVVMAQLAECHTFQDLLIRFHAPDDELVSLLAWLCTEGEILLRPRLLFGTSCALRLRELIAEISP
jgi:hypothetical protein